MKQFLVFAVFAVFGAAVVSCSNGSKTVERSKREYGYGHDSYGDDKGHDGYGYDKGHSGYGYGYGKGHDSYHDDGYGYGHDHHGYGYGTTRKGRSSLGLLGLLLPAAALLPLLFAIPAVAALAGAGTALVPVTTTLGTFTAGNMVGRKKREAIYKEVQKKNPKLVKTLMEAETVVNYLENMNVKVDFQDQLMYSHLACSGLLDRSNECLQRLSCELNDPVNIDFPELEKQVGEIVLNNILTNKKIAKEVKIEIRRARQYGRLFPGKCNKFSCSSAQQHKFYKSFTESS